MIRLAIVEDHPALADGLATLIQGSPDVEVVGTAPDVLQATELIEREKPDVVLCDIRLADDAEDGFTLVRRFAPRPAFIMLTVVSYPSYHARAVELGAMGYLSKMTSVDQILVAIRAVAAGGTAYPSDTRRSANEALRRPTPRELDTLGLVAEGLSNVEQSPSGCRYGSRRWRVSCGGSSTAMTSPAERLSRASPFARAGSTNCADPRGRDFLSAA